MKILYYTKINFANQGNSGIVKKIFSQAKALRAQGFDCDLFYFENNDCVLVKNNGEKQVFHFENTWQRVWFQNFSHVKTIDFEQYKAVYIRHFFLHPLVIGMLRKWKKSNPAVKVVMEIASYPYIGQARKDSWREQITYRLDAMLTPFLKRYVEVILTFSPFKKIYGIPTLRTSNGIDTDGVKIINMPIYNEELHILGLANVQQWHGFDRVVAGIKNYYSGDYDKKVFFHIVGKGDELPLLKKMVNSPELEKQILFHGAKYGDELESFFEKCQVAVSSLGMHRIGVANGETSNLKVREYCAKGVPFINGYLDRDLPSDFLYAYQIPANEEPVNIQGVIDFYENLRKENPFYPTEMNDFAKKHLTWKAKLQVVVDYLS